MIHTIYPYQSTWKGHKVWQFDDPNMGCVNQGIVSGLDNLCNQVASTIYAPGEDDKWIELTFSYEPFEGWALDLVWQRAGEGEGLASGHQGNWYKDTLTGLEGWMCPSLYKYFFERAPDHIYVKFGEAPPDKRVKMAGEFTIL